MTQCSFHIQTFGCQMNANDSDWLRRSLLRRGFEEVPFEAASIHILNTCSVRDKPEQKVYSELGRIARFAKVHERDDILVCVGGCVAQQIGAKLKKRFPQVRLVFGTDGVAAAPEHIERLVAEPWRFYNLTDFTETYTERTDDWSAEEQAPASAFVNIMQGCDNFCAYCIVPFVRGRQKSREPEAVLKDCRTLLEAGAREITLLGQNVNSYGLDAGKRGLSFASLMHKVAALPGLARLRFVTPHPKDIAPEVIEAFGSLPALCPRLHLPLQSGSDRILAAMNRRYTVEKYLDIVESIRKVRPDMLFTTDIIVGFPGETEEDFAQTMQVMREVGYASSFSFVYSDRPGAKAVLLPDKVERKVGLERLSRLQDWQNNTNISLLAAQVGTEKTVLLESASPRAPLPDNGAPIAEAVPLALQEGWVSWQGKTPEGFIVNVPLPPAGTCPHHGTAPQATGLQTGTWKGVLLPVSIDAAARHSLKGSYKDSDPTFSENAGQK